MIFRPNYYFDSEKESGIRIFRDFSESYSLFKLQNHSFYARCVSKVLQKCFPKSGCYFASGKCSGCKSVSEFGVLALKVNGEISVLFGKATAVELVFYFSLKDIVLKDKFTNKLCNLKALVHLVAEEDINQAKTAKF